MPNGPLQTPDYWRVNSYGYPNYFSTRTKAQEAWTTLLSFYDHEGHSYSGLKQFWQSHHASRRLDNHAVESWKATFEEFGLLYVISRSDHVSITPAGEQFYAAAQQNNQDEFVWIGLNLLFRYPLQGPPRGRPKSPAHSQSDLLPYRFLYSAMRDCGDYFWWTEMERIFCRVFSTSEARHAVDSIRQIRDAAHLYTSFGLPTTQKAGGFYNSLNQVANHAGMNHLVLDQDDSSEHYGASESRRRHLINRRFLSIVSAALGDVPSAAECRISARYVDRLPQAPRITDEQDYFDYLGAPVPALASLAGNALQTVTVAGEAVFVLKAGDHFANVVSSNQERTVEGSTSVLCRIARNHRVILSNDLAWTYLVTGKVIAGPNSVRLSLRRARPITNMGPIQELLGDDDA